jgi:hypothetical protein
MKRISVVALILALSISFCNYCASAEPIHPILKEDATRVDFPVPKEQRDEKYSKFLSASVKVSVNGSAGSGTIIYYDQSSEWVYVLSCGHLWEGNKEYGSEPKVGARVTVWYKNGKKLPEPRTYDAEVLFWSNDRGYDSSLVRFKCDWIPEYFPISPKFKLKKGDLLNSMGCDGGREVARYEVRFVEKKSLDIITELNSPRPGRSGGGLVTNEGELVGICWGTSDISGKGIGYFTPVSSMETVFSKNNHIWLIGNRKIMEIVPIKDWDKPDRKYEGSFIPMPIMF